MQDQVSLLNYIRNIESLSKRESEVLKALKELGGSASSWDIINYIGVSNPNIVRPRLNGLLKKGIVEKIGIIHREIEGKKISENIWKVVDWN